ncbi:hypothetical protein BH09MYX1_BH09MYX1_51600 [soil metagenome]
MRTFIVFIVLAVASVGAAAPPDHEQQDQHPSPDRPGCCSHHGGVCGCASSQAPCCDRTLSPSCGC